MLTLNNSKILVWDVKGMTGPCIGDGSGVHGITGMQKGWQGLHGQKWDMYI